MTQAKRRNGWPSTLVFLGPTAVGLLLFAIGPVLFSLAMAFTDWDLSRHQAWSDERIKVVGFANFTNLLWGIWAADFWRCFGNTVYLMLAIPVSIAGSLILALCLHRAVRATMLFRIAFYLPSVTAGVSTLLLWKMLLRPKNGLVNHVLGFFHLPQPEWLDSAAWIKPAIMLIGLWVGVGGTNMILYLAALVNVPLELEEAAAIDGAGAWQRFWHVTWPHLAPTTLFVVIISTIGGLQGGFEQVRVLTSGGGPGSSAMTLSYYLFVVGFDHLWMGRACAIAWVLFAIIMLFTLVYWRFGNREVD